jgi:hypothetical protein
MVHIEAINAIPSQHSEFRTVIWTGESSQLVLMTIPVGGDIGEEVSQDRRSGRTKLDRQGKDRAISALNKRSDSS